MNYDLSQWDGGGKVDYLNIYDKSLISCPTVEAAL